MLTSEQTIIELDNTLRGRAAACLRELDCGAKCRAVKALRSAAVAHAGDGIYSVKVGRPSKPDLVDPRELPRRKLGTPEGHGAFIHAICHIEYTAINLALDAVARFPGLPQAYYHDWIGVAAEEAIHFELLSAHLNSLGYRYGDFPAHDGLWDMAERTADDVLRRMALVPRVMEARGLDVTPPMIKRLNAISDHAGVAILERILADEIGHVAIGSRWFAYFCRERCLEAEQTFATLVDEAFGQLRANHINRGARRRAGFSDEELDRLIQ